MFFHYEAGHGHICRKMNGHTHLRMQVQISQSFLRSVKQVPVLFFFFYSVQSWQGNWFSRREWDNRVVSSPANLWVGRRCTIFPIDTNIMPLVTGIDWWRDLEKACFCCWCEWVNTSSILWDLLTTRMFYNEWNPLEVDKSFHFKDSFHQGLPGIRKWKLASKAWKSKNIF